MNLSTALLLVCFGLLLSCDSYHREGVSLEPQPLENREGSGSQDEDNEEPEVLTYEIIKGRVIDRYCLSCHQPGGEASFVDFRFKDVVYGYIEPGNSLDSFFYQIVASGEMPTDRRLPSELEELLKAWIDEGAL